MSCGRCCARCCPCGRAHGRRGVLGACLNFLSGRYLNSSRRLNSGRGGWSCSLDGTVRTAQQSAFAHERNGRITTEIVPTCNRKGFRMAHADTKLDLAKVVRLQRPIDHVAHPETVNVLRAAPVETGREDTARVATSTGRVVCVENCERALVSPLPRERR
jgi:hypothetical protein